MAREIRVGRSGAGAVLRLKRDLANPERLLKRIGITLLEQAQGAFQSQRLGDIKWPHRYPNQGEPFLNLAGAVQDLANGPTIKARRFDRLPALQDTGALKQSLAPRATAMRRVGSHTVEVGSTLPYAGLHQWGGESEQRITPTIKANLRKYLSKEEKARGKRQQARRAAAGTVERRLGFLFGADVLATSVVQRPFLGITDTAERRIVKEVEDALAGGS